MPKSLKIVLIALGGILGLLVIVAVAALFFVDINAYKPRLEAAASGAMGMEVRVDGRLRVGFFPGLLVTLEDVHIRNRGTELVSVSEARLGVDLLPLLHKEVRIGKIALKRPRIAIVRDREGKFNFELPGTGDEAVPAPDLANISLSDGTLLYADQQSGKGFEAGDCSADVRRPRPSEGEGPRLLRNLSFTAELACGQIRTSNLMVSDLKLSVEGKSGVFNFKPVTMRVFGGLGAGSIRADFTGSAPLYHVRYSLSQFHIDEFLKTLSPQEVALGSMDFSTDLSMQGKTVNEMTQTAEGRFSLRGEGLTLNGRDLDREFSKYESSQNFNLVDVGAFFFAGPVGLAVTKGYNFATIFQGSGGQSEIRTLVSEWKVERGVAQAQDVAMATTRNRVALQGALDFVNERYNHVTVALIDAKGCAKVRQKIRGTFHKPVVEKPNIFKSLTGPALELLKKGQRLFPGGECEVFYASSVAPPK